MKHQLICCIRKDVKEYLRSRRNVLFCLTLLSLGIMVLGATKLLPDLIRRLTETVSGVVTDPSSVSDTLLAFFPTDWQKNMGIFASDVAVFYGIVTVLSCYSLIVKEIQAGKWIFPLSAGYQPMTMIFSKGLVFGAGAAGPVVVFYMLYYFAGSTLLQGMYPLPNALIHGLTLGFAVFAMVYIAILLSAVCKRAIMAAISVLMVVLAVPDILTLFSFGKFFPTHLLTFVYTASDVWEQLIIPAAGTGLCCVILTVIAAKKASKIEVLR